MIWRLKRCSSKSFPINVSWPILGLSSITLKKVRYRLTMLSVNKTSGLSSSLSGWRLLRTPHPPSRLPRPCSKKVNAKLRGPEAPPLLPAPVLAPKSASSAFFSATTSILCCHRELALCTQAQMGMLRYKDIDGKQEGCLPWIHVDTAELNIALDVYVTEE